MKNPQVSIIMPVYNAEKYLYRSIESVRNQNYGNWELLIVDDGSTDSSLKICQEQAKDEQRIKVICNKHGGTAIARNTAIEKATGEYIAFLDADDAFHPLFLRAMVNAVTDSKAQIALCRTIRGTDATAFLEKKLKINYVTETKEEIFGRMYNGQWPDMIAPYTKIYARKLFDKVKFPSGRFFEDAATIHLAIYYSNKISITETPLYFYNITPNSSSVTKRSYELLDREWALRSHWEFFLKEERTDLAFLSLSFYLIELISIYHRIETSDCPKDCEKIRERFEKVYKEYHKKVVFTNKQSEQILAFRYPHLYDIKIMIKSDGIIRTVLGFVRRKMEKLWK